MKTVFIFCLIFILSACSLPSRKQHKQQSLAAGKQLSFQSDKGNCLACHIIEDGEDPGNIGPALVDIQARFATKLQLKAIIWDATQFNSETSMPPFGKNKILSVEELELVVDYIWTLTDTPNQLEKEW